MLEVYKGTVCISICTKYVFLLICLLCADITFMHVRNSARVHIYFWWSTILDSWFNTHSLRTFLTDSCNEWMYRLTYHGAYNTAALRQQSDACVCSFWGPRGRSSRPVPQFLNLTLNVLCKRSTFPLVLHCPTIFISPQPCDRNFVLYCHMSDFLCFPHWPQMYRARICEHLLVLLHSVTVPRSSGTPKYSHLLRHIGEWILWAARSRVQTPTLGVSNIEAS